MQQSPYKGKTGIQRILNACTYSLDGLKAAFQYEDAFRQEIFVSAILIPVAFYLEPGSIGRALMIASVLLVLIVELLNSAMEAALDRISVENHPLIKRAKDMGSAAVMVALINVLVIWFLVLSGYRIWILVDQLPPGLETKKGRFRNSGNGQLTVIIPTWTSAQHQSCVPCRHSVWPGFSRCQP